MRDLNIIKIIVNYLKNNGFNYVIRVNDKFLSGWGNARNRQHVEIIACESTAEAIGAKYYFYREKTFTYFNWYPLTYENINKIIGNRSYSLRNDFIIAKLASNINRKIDVVLTNGETSDDLSKYVNILNANGFGNREYLIINNLKSFYAGHTWNEEHKVITFESAEGETFSLDLVTGRICG